VTPSEGAAWARDTAPTFLDNLTLAVDGEPVSLEVRSASMRLLDGQGGLQILRFEGLFAGPVGRTGDLVYRDGNDADHIGWREITAVGEDGEAIAGSNVPTQSVSDALLSYPQDLLSSPLRVTSMRASFAPGVSVGGSGERAAADDAARPGIDTSPFASLVDNHGIVLVLAGFALALAFGAWHALLPGHGKTLMAAYMVGSDTKVRQAVTVGSAVAIMHTASVLSLGLLVVTLERTFRPESLYPWLGLLSGVVAIGLGAYLLIGRLTAWSNAHRARAQEHEHDAADGHTHGHAHADGHVHGLPAGVALTSRRGMFALALAGGILPSPSALIVMLGAINAHRVGYGIGLILAFSAGLALALIVVSLGALRARAAMASRLSSFWVRLVPVVSAGAIVAVGLYLAVRGAIQI
jgi:ABC-type nickel/cobalt efflux system permease component RcnA